MVRFPSTKDWYDIAKNLVRFRWDNVSDHDTYSDGSERSLEYAHKLSAAELLSSEILTEGGAEKSHKVLLDLDVPAQLVPSSTEGHSHLYIDVSAPWEKIEALLDAMVGVGAVEPGYADVCKKRRMTNLRTPWTVKTYVTQGLPQKVFHEAIEQLEKS
jgi:hypothetical protein